MYAFSKPSLLMALYNFSYNHQNQTESEVLSVPPRFRKESLDSAGVRWSPEDYKLAERPANFSIPAVSQSGGVGPLRN
jgi:hypothetical protein